MEKKINFNGFKSQKELDEITEIIANLMFDIPSITEICGYSVHLISVDEIDITFTVNNEKYWYTIELWADIMLKYKQMLIGFGGILLI